MSLNETPFIQKIRIFSREEAKELDSVVRGRESLFSQSKVLSISGGLDTSNIRTSKDLRLEEEDPLCQALHRGVDQGLFEYTNTLMNAAPIFERWPMACDEETVVTRENLQILWYYPGDQYVTHHDTHDCYAAKEYHRTFSTVLYLNDDFEGGGTGFLTESFKPEAGEALYFPSNWCFPHCGLPVLSGEKRVVVTWWYSIKNLDQSHPQPAA